MTSVLSAKATLQSSTSRLTATGEKANLPRSSLAMCTSTCGRAEAGKADGRHRGK